MKFTFFTAAISLTMAIGCSHQSHKIQRVPASSLVFSSVGVIGAAGEVILYYKEGNYIKVKSCERNSVLGKTPKEAKNNCVGKTNGVPVEVFKQAIRNLVSTDRLNTLKPLTAEEVNAYNSGGQDDAQIEAMVTELDKINDFIKAYGESNTNLVRKEELVKSLKNSKLKAVAIKKIKKQLEKAINLITDDSKLAIAKFSNDKELFLYNVLKNFNPAEKYPCGLEGSIEERIRDCSIQQSEARSSDRIFVLVTRDTDFKEIHKDTKSGLLWSGILLKKMSQYDAQRTCKSEFTGILKSSSTPGRLPTIEEYKVAETHGFRTAFPNTGYLWFWSSTELGEKYANKGSVFNGVDGNTDSNHLWVDYSVRCVAE